MTVRKNRNNNVQLVSSGTATAEGPAEPHTEVKARKRRNPGFTARPDRVEDWKELEREGLRIDHPDWSEREIVEAADRAYEEISSGPRWERLLKVFEETTPISHSVPPSETNAMVELAAMFRLGRIRGLVEALEFRTSARGKAAQVGVAIAVLLHMCFGRGRTQIKCVFDEVTSCNAIVAWAHDYPDSGLPQRSIKTLYQALPNMLKGKGADTCVSVNIELVKMLAKLRNEGEFPRKRGGTRRKGQALMIGEVGIVDGSLIAAPVQQRMPQNARQKIRLHGPRRQMVDATQYKDEKGRIRRFVVGYREIILVDMASTLILARATFPASGDERKALLRLLEELFETWPDCPMRAVVGDSLFQHSKQLSHDLVFNWGIQPIFPKRKGDFTKDLPHAETDGVPHCGCGTMKLKDTVGFYTADVRAEKGIERGAPAPNDNARIRWECPNDICKPVTTYPRDDARLYTFFPRRGDHQRSIEREVFLHRRNAVESVFASLQRLGFGRDKYEAPPWAHDHEFEWLFGLGSIALTARRLIHETDLYESANKEAESLELLTQPDLSCPSPGPSQMALARARRERAKHVESPIPPAGWEHLLPSGNRAAATPIAAAAA